MVKRNKKLRRAINLVETVLVITLSSLLLAPVVGLIKTAHTVWEGHDSDWSKFESVNATARHFTRQLREAEQVTAITSSGKGKASLTVLLSTGKTIIWSYDGGKFEVTQSTDGQASLLADNIHDLSFVGYKKDGVTQTTVPSEIQAVQCTVTTQLTRKENASYSQSCWVWLREWQ